MDYEIEDYSQEEAENLKIELNYFFEKAGTDLLTLANIKKIIITDSFDLKVKSLTKTSNYDSDRGIENAIGKMIDIGDFSNIIIFKSTFFKAMSLEMKYMFLAHEFDHCINNILLPGIFNSGKADHIYLTYIKHMFNEYSANLYSHLIFNNEISEHFKNYLFADSYGGFLQQLIDENYFYKPLKEKIETFFRTNDILGFNNDFYRVIDPLVNNIVYLFSLIDGFDFIANDFNKQSKINFINESTYILIDYFRKWYKARFKLEIIFEDALEQMKLFFFTNLGVYITDYGPNLNWRIFPI